MTISYQRNVPPQKLVRSGLFIFFFSPPISRPNDDLQSRLSFNRRALKRGSAGLSTRLYPSYKKQPHWSGMLYCSRKTLDRCCCCDSPQRCDNYSSPSVEREQVQIPRLSYQSPVEIVGTIVTVAAWGVMARNIIGAATYVRAKRVRWYMYFLTGHENVQVRAASTRAGTEPKTGRTTSCCFSCSRWTL
jgi:hypothetical protein